MKRKIVRFGCLFFLAGLSLNAAANNQVTDTTVLAKKIAELEKKIDQQQQQINDLKAPKASKSVFVVDRRGSKQLVKKTI